MQTLYTEGYAKLSKFIFEFYDFDKDGMITRDDVRVVLSYIPLKSEKYSQLKLKYEQEEYKDRVESQNELSKILEKCFGKNEFLNYEAFQNIIENLNSDMFLYILIFLLDKRPFSKSTLNEINGIKNKSNYTGTNFTKTPQINSKYLIASPNLQSKFTPSLTISKSPSIAKRNMLMFGNAPTEKDKGSNILFKLAGKTENSQTNIKDNVLLKYAKNSSKIDALDDGTDEGIINDIKNIPITRKQRNNLKEIDKREKMRNTVEYEDLPITPAVKLTRTENYKTEDDKVYLDDEDSDEEETKDIKYEGYLYKITQTKKLKKLWFKLLYKDLYYFKTEDETIHKGMHNLSGVFIKEDQPLIYDGKSLYCFSVIYPKKVRFYYVDNEKEYQSWMTNIRKATGYANLSDIYEIRDKLGNGKFGLVRLGVHKTTGRKVAVKIMKKRDMSISDLELVKTEIEILKVCQQPNIIQLYDVFENVDYIYISII